MDWSYIGMNCLIGKVKYRHFLGEQYVEKIKFEKYAKFEKEARKDKNMDNVN